MKMIQINLKKCTELNKSGVMSTMLDVTLNMKKKRH